MTPGASLLGDGPLAVSWLSLEIYEPSELPATAAIGNPALMATYQPAAIPAQAKLNDIALTWIINPTIPTQSVYVCIVSSPTLGDLELPMGNFQGYLRNDGTSFVSATIPDVVRWIDRIEPLLIDASMTIYSGEQFPDGTRQLEAIAWADYPLTLRTDRGATNPSITLSGNHTFVPTAPKTRPLTGVTYRRVTNGRRAFRCRLDAFLKPGDTADVAGEQFTVSDINYLVSIGQETMEVQEDPTG